MTGIFSTPYGSVFPAVRPRVFISYHHGGDQFYYNLLSGSFAAQHEIVHDASLERALDSEDLDYVRWTIRDDYIRGTSCTIVLCGAQTPQRKYVDWEVKATLDMEHGLVAIDLPTVQRGLFGMPIHPNRVEDNILSGYAVHITDWYSLTPQTFAVAVTQARAQADACKYLIHNWRDLKARNG